MCLGIPGKVVETYRDHDLLMGKVDFGGVCKRVCLEHVPEALPGEYVLVHVGFALNNVHGRKLRQRDETSKRQGPERVLDAVDRLSP